MPLFTEMPRRASWPSIIDVPLCNVKLLFQPPVSVRLLLISTTSSKPVPVYVPVATAIASPTLALLIAPLIVAQGELGVKQEFASFPVGATYNALFWRLKSTYPAPLAEARTV